jgi:hypothetical protein
MERHCQPVRSLELFYRFTIAHVDQFCVRNEKLYGEPSATPDCERIDEPMVTEYAVIGARFGKGVQLNWSDPIENTPLADGVIENVERTLPVSIGPEKYMAIVPLRG